MKKIAFSILCLCLSICLLGLPVLATTEKQETTYQQEVLSEEYLDENVVENIDENEVFNAISNESVSDAFLTAFSENGVVMIVALIIIVLLIVIFLKSSKKKSRTQDIKNEIKGYIIRPEPHKYSGNINILHNGIQYSRGNKRVTFDIKIDKNTILAPFMIDAWFENRNYNQREALLILQDISHYLSDSRLCKSVSIVSDEEFEKNDETSEAT